MPSFAIENPDFVRGSFRVEAGSPALDLCDFDSPHSLVDFDYQPRPNGGLFDVGADEH